MFLPVIPQHGQCDKDRPEHSSRQLMLWASRSWRELFPTPVLLTVGVDRVKAAGYANNARIGLAGGYGAVQQVAY